MTTEPWFVYLVRCKDNSLYCGITNDIENRIKKHNNGTGAKYINYSKRPVILVYSSEFPSRSEASKEEYQIKKLSKKEKEKLVQDWKN